MHVLITSDTMTSGLWIYTRELVSGLISRGFRVTLVSFGEIPFPAQTAWMERLDRLEYHPTAFRLDWMHEGQQDFPDASAYLCSLVEEVRPDLFHANHLCYGALPVSIPHVTVAHGDLVTWWNAVHGRGPKRSPWLSWYQQTVANGLVGSTAVVAASDWMLDTIAASYSVLINGTVINHGRNPVHFNPYVTKEDTALSVGRPDDPADQVHLLAERWHPVAVYVASAKEPVHSSDETAFRAEVRFRDGDEGVVLAGPQSEAQLRLLYSRAALYVCTSRYDPSGMAVLEAALSRCALILNDIPALREIWGPAAVYFRSNDADSLSEAVRIMSSDDQLRRNFANRAFNRARECYNANRMTDNYIQLYHRVATQAAKAA